MMELNQIYNMDCLEGMKQLEDNSIDLIITSPPYWKGFAYESYFNSYNQYIKWCDKWIKEIKRILKNDGTFYLNVINDSEVTTRAFELMQVCSDNYLKLHDTIIWYRYNSQPANTTRQLTNQCEYLFMFVKFSSEVELNKEKCYKQLPEIFKTKNVGNVWEIPFNTNKHFSAKKETEGRWGHSGFPKKLAKACILLSSKQKDIILDCFMGSGTTAVACKQLNRNFIGFELNKEYCNIANKRLEQQNILKDNV